MRKLQILCAILAVALTLGVVQAQPAAAGYPPGSCTGCR
jgi:hypothetical protein